MPMTCIFRYQDGIPAINDGQYLDISRPKEELRRPLQDASMSNPYG
jgi:hypothetical protein